MLNEILHRLTNKTRDTSVPDFPVDSRFVPTVPDAFETALREGMLVNENPYYLHNYIQLIHTFPELLTVLDERARTFNPGRNLAIDGTITGGTLEASEDGTPPLLYRDVQEWPVRFSITYSDPSAGFIQTDFMGSKVPYELDGNGNVQIVWPTWAGVQGAVHVTSTSFTVTQNPARFPCTQLVGKLALNSGLIPVLRKADLINHYHWAETDEERVAIAATALCLYNKITSD